MPFTWNNTQPSPSQNISTGQSTILNNFQYLGDASTLTGKSATGSGNIISKGGYFVFPNGFIVQFFTITNPGPTVSSGDTYPFLIPFTQLASISVVLTPLAHSTSDDVIWIDQGSSGKPVTVNNFTVRTSTTWQAVYVIAMGV